MPCCSKTISCFPNMTVADNVCAGVKGRGRRRRAQKARRALSGHLWSGRFCRPLPARASRAGSSERVALARMVAAHPHLYVRRVHERTRFLS